MVVPASFVITTSENNRDIHHRTRAFEPVMEKRGELVHSPSRLPERLMTEDTREAESGAAEEGASRVRGRPRVSPARQRLPAASGAGDLRGRVLGDAGCPPCALPYFPSFPP